MRSSRGAPSCRQATISSLAGCILPIRLRIRYKVNPVERDRQLTAAMAAARRLLLHAIDIRFGLDEVAEADEQNAVDACDLARLSAAVAALRRETEALQEALLWPAMTEDQVTD